MPVHLPDCQPIIFQEGAEREAILRSERQCSMLTGWFQLNRTDPNARKLLYSQIPLYYTWKSNDHEWSPRRRNAPKVIARIFNINPNQEELFYLRFLLLHVRGAQSFEDLYTYRGIKHKSFKDVCIARDFLHDDQIWDKTLREAAHREMPQQLRQLFVTILVNGNVAYPLRLWEKYKKDLFHDFLYQLRGKPNQRETSEQQCLADLEIRLKSSKRSCALYGLPVFEMETPLLNDGALRTKEQNEQLAATNISLLNPEQKTIFDAVVLAVLNWAQGNEKNCFFIDGPAGTGKTFLQSVNIFKLLVFAYYF